MDIKALLKQPVALESNNFTPLSRTPWAGSRIFPIYKQHLHHKGEPQLNIGESWEFSCDPSFPSRVVEANLTLAELVASHPEEVLSAELLKNNGSHQCEILVKLLDADQPLSLQIHPDDADSALQTSECGKPESWYVLHAEKGSGIYLGFSKKLSKDELRVAIETGDHVAEKLEFVEVSSGDYFEIAPGVPHAIGAGVTLLEPQRIVFGKTGKTYRFWDWDRKYDASGHLDMDSGLARELHLEEALAIANPSKQIGLPFVDSLRRAAEVLMVGDGCQLSVFPKNDHYQLIVFDLQADASCKINITGGYACVTGLLGDLGFCDSKVRCKKGESILLPHAALPLTLNAKMTSKIAMIIPSSATLSAESN